MNANVYVIEDYENDTALRPKKTNPIQTQSNPVLSAVEWANLETTPGQAPSTELRASFDAL